MSTNRNTDVLIIGAGPTGMVASLCLSQQGISNVIVERRKGVQAHPKAHELSARSLEILDVLGVPFEELAREASPYADGSRVVFCENLKHEFGCIDLQHGGGAAKYRRHLAAPAPYLNVSQVEVERVLIEHVQRAKASTLAYNQQWESSEEVDGGVVSTITNRPNGESYQIRSRYVICADGAGSRSRKALGIEMVGPESLADFVSAYIQADLSELVQTRGKLYFIFNAEAPGAFIAHHIERRWVFHARIMTPHEKVEDITEAEMARRIRLAMGRDDIPVDVVSMSPWRMTAQVAEAFSKGRLYLAGDAAHRFPPTGGLGMNSGIGDAHNLAWKMAAVLKGQAPEALLETYEAERRPVVEVNCDESRRNFDRMETILSAFGLDPDAADELAKRLSSAPVQVLPKGGQAWLRRQAGRYGSSVIQKTLANPELKAKVAAAVAEQRPHFDRIGLDLGYVYPTGAFLEDGTPAPATAGATSEYTPTTRPGSRFPHFWIDGKRATRSSRAWIRYGRYTLLVGAACAMDGEGLAALCEARGVALVRLNEAAGIPLACSGLVHTRCELAKDGALLIRPDGHVAWRDRAGVRVSAALLGSILEQVLGSA